MCKDAGDNGGDSTKRVRQGFPREVQFISFRPSCKDYFLESSFHQLTLVNILLYCEFNYARDHSRHFGFYLKTKRYNQ